jgi:16S rRNA processing protein RimM
MIVLGRIAAPFGVKGWIKVHPYGDDPESWCEMHQWWLGSDAADADWQPLQLRACRMHGEGLVALLDGIYGRDGAAALTGRLVAVPREELPEPAEGEFYWSDLVGLEVVNEDGECLGRVAELISTGAHEVLVVRDEQGCERLLPFVQHVVRHVDRAGSTIRVAWQLDW